MRHTRQEGQLLQDSQQHLSAHAKNTFNIETNHRAQLYPAVFVQSLNNTVNHANLLALLGGPHSPAGFWQYLAAAASHCGDVSNLFALAWHPPYLHSVPTYSHGSIRRDGPNLQGFPLLILVWPTSQQLDMCSSVANH